MLDGKSIVNEQSINLREKDPHVVLYHPLFLFAYFAIPFDPVYLSSGIVNVAFRNRDGSFSIGIAIFCYRIPLIRISHQNIQSRNEEIDRKSAPVSQMLFNAGETSFQTF